LNSVLPPDSLWEIEWKTALNNAAISWGIFVKDDRIIIQNESGWQLFDKSGKNIADGIKADGDLTIDPSLPLFYFNDPSGYIAAADLITGKEKFLFYPFLGSAYDRTILYSSGNKIISVGRELPVMTHNAPIKTPELTIFELLDLGKSREVDEDGILDSTAQIENLICKSSNVAIANNDSMIVLAVPNHFYMIDKNLQIIKDLKSEFIPLEISIDEEMRIYSIVEIQEKDNTRKTELWIIDSAGNLISNTSINVIPYNFLSPPIVDFEHNVYLRYEDRVLAISINGNKLWEQFIQKPLAGLSAADDLLITSEGDLLSAFEHNGERRFIFNFEEELLSTSAVIIDKNIYVATTQNLYCLTPKK
jgi:hypothetical protein